MRLLIILGCILFVFPLSSQTLYNYDEIWNGKSEAINAAQNNNNFNVYTEVYNQSISPFKNPNWQQFTHNTIYVQENNFTQFSNWGGVNINMYRDLVGYNGRDRAEGVDPNTETTVRVNNRMSVAEIRAVITAAEPKTTILFEAGTYDFNESLWISKDNLTLRGETDGNGNSLVLIDMFDIATVADGIPAAFQIRKPAISSIFGLSQSTTALPILTTNTTTTVQAEGKMVTLQANDISMIEAGDFIVFSYQGDPFFNERDRVDQERLRSVAEIASVDYTTRQVTLKTGVGIDYNPNRAVSTNQVLVVEKEDVIRDVIIKDFIFQSYSDASFSAIVDANDYTNTRPAFKDGTSAISIRTGHEIDLQNIIVKNAASSGIALSGCFEIYIDNYLFDGAMNNGAGGNGYGLIVGDVYYSNITNYSTGTDKPIRHAIVFAFGTSCGYNNINMPYCNSNADFHGGPDYGNIIYFDQIDVRQMDTGNSPIFDYRYEWHPRNFGNYTPPPLNQMQNTIIMKTANAPKEGVIAGYTGFDNPNDSNDDLTHRNDGQASSNNQTIYASGNGATINTWGNDDIIVSGAGNDVIDGGDNQDFFVFFSNSGNDVLKSYINSKGVKNTLANTRDERGFSFRTAKDSEGNLLSRGDKIVVREKVNNTDITTPTDVLAKATQSNNDVVIDLGGGNTITIEDFDVNDLSADDFVVLEFTNTPPPTPTPPSQATNTVKAFNILSPNADGQNDVWQVLNLDIVDEYSIKVFTKTGQVVFESSNYQNDWTGTYQQKPLPSGTYYYTIITNKRGAKDQITGFITLIR